MDDGSTDSSVAKIRKFIEGDNRFRLICNYNHGVAYSRNTGIEAADTEFILPLDSDDYFECTYVERAVKHFEAFPDTTLFYGKWHFIGYNEDEMNARLSSLHYTSYENLLIGNSIHCSCVFRKKDAIERGMYDSTLDGFEDWEFLIRLLYRDRSVTYDPTVSLFYRQLCDARSTTSNQNFGRIRQEIMEKNMSIYKEVFGR